MMDRLMQYFHLASVSKMGIRYAIDLKLASELGIKISEKSVKGLEILAFNHKLSYYKGLLSVNHEGSYSELSTSDQAKIRKSLQEFYEAFMEFKSSELGKRTLSSIELEEVFKQRTKEIKKGRGSLTGGLDVLLLKIAQKLLYPVDGKTTESPTTFVSNFNGDLKSAYKYLGELAQNFQKLGQATQYGIATSEENVIKLDQAIKNDLNSYLLLFKKNLHLTVTPDGIDFDPRTNILKITGTLDVKGQQVEDFKLYVISGGTQVALVAEAFSYLQEVFPALANRISPADFVAIVEAWKSK